MSIRYLSRTMVAAVTVLGLTACEDSLAVKNTDQPDVPEALATMYGVEAILRNSFSQILGATHGTSNALQPAAMVMALESYGSVANFGMNLRATIPRAPIDNTPGNATEIENFRDFQALSLRGRTIANALQELDSLIARGRAGASKSIDLRARSFGFFSLAIANAHLALMYDSVAVSKPTLEWRFPAEVPPLVGYAEAMEVALSQMDSALVMAQQASTSGNSFTLPAAWLRTYSSTRSIGTPVSLADYIKIIRSAKARYRAGVARTPEARAAVDWAAVLADAENGIPVYSAANGITGDVTLDMNSNEGWGHAWLNQAMVFVGWHSMTPYVIGMGDTSSNYSAWVTQSRATRSSFLIHSPDERFPKGATRADQEARSPGARDILPDIYFRNRAAGGDTPGETWGNSPYDLVRFRAYRSNSQIGPWVWMSATEIAMLRAEALIRLNRAPEAMTIINYSRVENDLPAFTDPAGRAPAHPGGSPSSCVPRTPTGPGNTLECGTLLEAMKWEKRMETVFTGYAQWYQDSRGWGDLPLGTPVQWPVPYHEMDSRGLLAYPSQTGAQWLSATSTYGFGVGTR